MNSTGLKERRTGIDRRRLDPPMYFGPERRKIIERRTGRPHRVDMLQPNRFMQKAQFFNRAIQTFLGKQGLKGGQTNKALRPKWSRQTMNLIDRTHERVTIESPVMVQEGDSHALFPGTLLNFSSVGMYIESETVPRLRSGIIIHMQNYASEAETPEDIRKYYGQVRWCRKLTGMVVFVRYGIGVKLIDDINDFVKLFSL
jgi:PilZ domain